MIDRLENSSPMSRAGETFRTTSVEVLRGRTDDREPVVAVAALLGLARVGDESDLRSMRRPLPRIVARRAQFAANLLAARFGVESPLPLPYDPPISSSGMPSERVVARRLRVEEATTRWAEIERQSPGTRPQIKTCWELMCRQVNWWFLAPAIPARELMRAVGGPVGRIFATVGRRGIDAETGTLDGYMLLHPGSKQISFWTATGVLAMSGECSVSRRGASLWLRTAKSFGPLLHELRARTVGDAWIVDQVSATAMGPPRSARAPTPAQ